MDNLWIAALMALFLWGFATGAILGVVRLCERRGPGAGRRAVVLALPVPGPGIWGYEASLGLNTVGLWTFTMLYAARVTASTGGPRPR
ncbi:MAG: hypothetical protein U5K36_02350 [Roseovarius sp.]|nr:hypothetical protein [Roseovarius sp.]